MVVPTATVDRTGPPLSDNPFATVILSGSLGALHWPFEMTVDSNEIEASQRAFCRERNAHFQNAPGESKLGFALATEGSRRFRCENSRMRDRGPSDEIASSDGQPKQLFDKLQLRQWVTFAHPFGSPLPNHVHRLDSL